MTLSRAQAFQRMRKALELRPPQEATVAERQRKIRDLVSEHLTVSEDFLTGSYARHTLITPLQSADVDIVLVLESSLRSKGPRGVLDAVRDVLKADYARTDISRNGQAVTVQFTDFAVDVVPAFSVGGWDHFWSGSGPLQICNAGSGGWIDTNPRKHIDISATANEAHAGNLVPRVKQLKAWNRAAGSPLHSFHLEVLAWSIFGSSSSTRHLQESDWAAARYFFEKAKSKVRERQKDPATNTKDVGEYLKGGRLEDAARLADVAYNRCAMAEMACQHGDLAVMHHIYSLVFGEPYPATT